MIRVLKFVVIVFFSLCLFSCGKKRSIHITATNGATGEPYAGLQYFVVSSTTTGGGEKYKTEKSGFLNENGEANSNIPFQQTTANGNLHYTDTAWKSVRNS